MITEAKPGINPDTNREKPVIEINERPSGYPDATQMIYFKNHEGEKTVPVFNCRIESHHESIAQYYANYKTAVAFGVGLYGAASLVESPRVGKHPDSNKAFKKVKPDRSDLDKIPLYIHYQDWPNIMDRDAIHPEFLPYTMPDREVRKRLYESGVAMHFIIPVLENHPDIDPIFVTQKEDWEKKRAPRDQWMERPTVSAFWWEDPGQEKIYRRLQSLAPNAFAGISSFNDHGEEPAWNFDKLIEYLIVKNRCPFDFVVSDPENEKLDVKSSHAQIAFPLKGEEPVWKVYRTGATDIDAFLKRLGSDHGYRIVGGAGQAARGHAKDVNLDPLVLEVYRQTLESHKKRQIHGVLRGAVERLIA